MSLFHRLAACIAFLGTAAVPTMVQAGVLVPAYFYPGTGGPGGVGDGWAAMTTAAGEISLTAVFNPDSGPLPGPADPNYVNALTNLENAGGRVIAYIPTGYGTTLLTTVESEATLYLSQYGSLINGFFIDQMTNDNSPGHLTYYHDLYTYLKGVNSAFEVIGNPGAPTDPGYLAPATQGADALVTYENNDLTQPYTASPPSSWVFASPASDFVNIVYNQSTVAGMVADVNATPSYNVGSVYVTDQTVPNPYSQLPSYWDQEVAAIQALPEPAALTLWSLGGLVAWLFGAARRRVS
ncbi:MAG TPA: spherulation-specific family 4 protein [Pirellulales bacterium]|nr:spherulation-specific family 4 protein [Pirellulales bacterium]